MTKRGSTFNDFSSIDSSYIYAMEKEILPEDAVKYYNFVLKSLYKSLLKERKGAWVRKNVTIVKANVNRENTFSKVFTRAT